MGFPVWVFLDKNGQFKGSQSTAVLEKGNSYDTDKIRTNLDEWLKITKKKK